MTSVQDIERAIGTLSAKELEELYAWMDERYAQSVDVGLARALEAGMMDSRIQSALAEHKAGKTREI
jgi:hypothetical protein